MSSAAGLTFLNSTQGPSFAFSETFDPTLPDLRKRDVQSPRVIYVRLAFPNFPSDYESVHASLLALILHNRVVEKRGTKDLRKVWNPGAANQRYILIYNVVLVRRKEDRQDITILVDHKPCYVSGNGWGSAHIGYVHFIARLELIW